MDSSTTLSDDMLIEIFIYLPLNSIYKFKCLSKVWLSNLSHHNFFIRWFKINSKSLPWIQYHPNTDHDSDENPLKFKMAYPDLHKQFMSTNEYLFSFKFLLNQKPSGSKLFLLGSSDDGLVLCLVNSQYHVCNPLTGKSVSIPSPPRSPSTEFVISGISHEYSSSSPYTSYYKVLLIRKFHPSSKKFNVDVFSSDLGVWESIQVTCDENVVCHWFDYKNFVILDGVFFWIQEGKKMLVYHLNQNNGSDGHQCSLIDLPDEEFNDGSFRSSNNRIGKSEGKLCYTKTKRIGRETTMSVWVLDEVNWQILHKDIPIDDILADRPSQFGRLVCFEVLGFSPVDCNVVLLSWKHLVWAFNLLTRSVEEFWGFNIHNRSVEEICMDRRILYLSGAFSPFVLKPMPTVLPSPCWIDT